MLKKLDLKGVGPAPEMNLEFSSRLNFLTGDNGLGKSFVLDTAWWVLTRTWARNIKAVPSEQASKPSIGFSYTKASAGDVTDSSIFVHRTQTWGLKQGRPTIPGIVIYAGVDGSFSVWDPARNYWKNDDEGGSERPKSFDFTPEQVWKGLVGPNGVTHCVGLVRDWVLWQRGRQPAFDDLIRVLEVLSPCEAERLVPGEPTQIGDDVEEVPSLKMPYGQEVPLPLASAGMRRICALAYLLVWTWREHTKASKKYRVKPAREIVFLIDEIECHLHPQWQRRIVPALLSVMSELTQSEKIPVQLLAATHSPLVLASVEPFYETGKDCILDFDLVENHVEVRNLPFTRKGDVNGWLASDIFNLKEPRSVEAEIALTAAYTLLRNLNNAIHEKKLTLNDKADIRATDKALRESLSDVDRFWVRWSSFRDSLLEKQ
ncbi:MULTISPECIES: AAA family ATPase [Pseudomonas]|uniref:AAA family ATPase n=1 Tax=Pseudomonas TaxID=286 RepID=UPI000811D578|nr:MULTISPECIES: AAA family ATPase [Pseudomonas]RZI20440.1 ATP-binding protein [Pseudomonas orientalis]CRM27294.1 putative ATP-binding protein involved in virulence [Pseudomonas sp. 28 E 9]